MGPAAEATAGAPALDAHERLVQALLHGDALPGDPARRRLIQTHISSLVVDGDRVYKLRKPLVLPFLDFSTPARRRADCEEELRLNRRTAPSLYIGVQPVTGTFDAPRLGGDEGAALDWVLEMRRFDDRLLLGRMAREGRVDAALVDALAATIAAFHAALPPSTPGYGEPAQVRRWALDNLDALEAVPDLSPEREPMCRLRAWTESTFQRLAPTLAERREAGFVREGHGDLHLDNIVLLDGVPRPFDALEFNPALRHADIVADIAFPFMDLWRHGLPHLAWRLADRWAQDGGDTGGLVLLRCFAVYRALVRAKVAALRGAQGDSEAFVAARRDLALAQAIAGLDPAIPRPRLVLTSGLSGSGKSTVALALVEALGAVRLRSDVERKRLHGLAPLYRPTPEQALTLYGREATRRTFDHLAGLAQALLAGGETVIVDAAFLHRAERDRFRSMAARQGVPALVVDCRAPEAVLRERLRERARSGHDPSDAGIEVLERQLAFHQDVAVDEPAAVLDTAADPATVAAKCHALARDILAGTYDRRP